MSAARGASAVGRLADLPPEEALAVRLLRLWNDGPEAQAEAWSDLSARLGPVRARRCLANFEALADCLWRHGRRPLMRHGTACACVGADEAVFAHFLALSADGAREDAMLLAALLVRADMAPMAASLGETVGLSLRAAAADMPARTALAGWAPRDGRRH